MYVLYTHALDFNFKSFWCLRRQFISFERCAENHFYETNLEEVMQQRLCKKTLFREVKGKGTQLKTMLLLEKVANHCQGGALQCSAV